MKKITILIVLLIIILGISLASIATETNKFKTKNCVVNHTQNESYTEGFGFIWIMNWNRMYIIKVDNNSPASKAGLSVGDEIKKINNIKITKFRNIQSYMQTCSYLEFYLKSQNNIYKTIKISKGKYLRDTVEEIDPLFELYWKQICNIDIDNRLEFLSAAKQVENKLSHFTKVGLENDYQKILIWKNKRDQFKCGYELCKMNSKNKDEMNACLTNLQNKFLYNIAQERNYEIQQRQLNMQQQQLNIQRQNMIMQNNMQQQQLNIQRQNMMLQNAPKYSDYMPKTYNVNLYHHY
ncbi:PDZ domain-containing protein [bacterium]|nr:PDZ domain-containing protein [bacterium]